MVQTESDWVLSCSRFHVPNEQHLERCVNRFYSVPITCYYNSSFSFSVEDWGNFDLFFFCLDTQLFISGYRNSVNLAKAQLATIKVMVSASIRSTVPY